MSRGWSVGSPFSKIIKEWIKDGTEEDLTVLLSESRNESLRSFGNYWLRKE